MNKRKRSLVEWGAVTITAVIVVSIEVLKVTVGYAWGKMLKWLWPEKQGEKDEEGKKQ